MDPLRILIVEDDENDVILLQKELRAGGLVFEPRVVDTQSDFVRALDESIPDLIIADFQLPRFDALSALELSQQRTRRTPFIIFTGCLDEATAVLCMKLGAWDYVLKQNPVRLVACIRSALERRRLVEEREQAVREGEQRFRQLADIAPVLIWMSDASGSFHYFNRAWLAFRGRSETEEQQSGWTEGVHPADRPRVRSILESKIGSAEGCQMEFRLRRHDGVYRWILCNGAPFHSGKERSNGYISSGFDITDIKEAETVRGHGHELIESLIEQIPGPAYAKDASGRFVAINQCASLLLGRNREAFVGRTNAQLGLDTEFAALETREMEVLQSGAPSSALGQASAIETRFAISPWGVTKDGVAGIIAVARSTSPGGLSSQSRHDLNNHVAIIRMYAEFLAEQPELGDRLVSKIRQISDSAEKLGAMIAALSDPDNSAKDLPG